MLFLGLAAVAQAANLVSPVTLQSRRAELRKALPDGVIVLFGRTDKEADELRSGFFQEPNFDYLTGWREPGAVLLLAPEGDNPETLFLPRRSPDREKWTGKKMGPDDPAVRDVTGFPSVMPVEAFESHLRRHLERNSHIYTLKQDPSAERLAKLEPLREIEDVAPSLAKMRMRKSAEELALIERATKVTLDAHRAAWQRAAPGVFEYQIAASMGNVYFDQGCERHAYSPIIGSGPNSVILHYAQNSRRMDQGEILLMDVGAECSGYVADVTRTIPVSGRFSARQREIYEVVLGAQKATIAQVKPGMTLARTAPNSLYKVAFDYINSHGKDLKGEPLGKYFIHGIGHHVGLEVHDASDPSAPLEAGMIIAIEPGIYIPEENMGIRIEDMILVTETGSRVLSAGLPKEIVEIERAVRK